MRIAGIGLACAGIALALCACERAGEPAPPEPEPVPASESAAADEVVIPAFDPSLPPLEIEPLPPESGHQPEPPQIRSTRTAVAPKPPAAPDDDHPSLEALFRASYPQPADTSTVDLGPVSPDSPVVPKPPGAIDRLGQSIRLERRAEAIGPAGPRQGAVYETEAGVRIPVDQSVSIEGGVRVDSREEPGAKEPDRRSTPRVGVEVRF